MNGIGRWSRHYFLDHYYSIARVSFIFVKWIFFSLFVITSKTTKTTTDDGRRRQKIHTVSEKKFHFHHCVAFTIMTRDSGKLWCGVDFIIIIFLFFETSSSSSSLFFSVVFGVVPDLGFVLERTFIHVHVSTSFKKCVSVLRAHTGCGSFIEIYSRLEQARSTEMWLTK